MKINSFAQKYWPYLLVRERGRERGRESEREGEREREGGSGREGEGGREREGEIPFHPKISQCIFIRELYSRIGIRKELKRGGLNS